MHCSFFYGVVLAALSWRAACTQKQQIEGLFLYKIVLASAMSVYTQYAAHRRRLDGCFAVFLRRGVGAGRVLRAGRRVVSLEAAQHVAV